jgi:hypothetical protein
MTSIRLVHILKAFSESKNAPKLRAQLLRDAVVSPIQRSRDESGQLIASSFTRSKERRDKTFIYVAVPTGLTVCAQVNHLENRGLVSVDDFTVIADHWDRDKAEVQFPKGHQEIEYLALEPEDIAHIEQNGHVEVRWFIAGLRLHHEVTKRSLGFYEETHLSGHLYLRRSSITGRRVEQLIDQLVFTYPSVALRVEVDDIYVDESRLSAVDAPAKPSMEDEDPHRLFDRAPGVHTLYSAARHFHMPKSASNPKRDDILRWLRTHGAKKLYNSTVAKQAAKFANPRYRRGSGITKRDQKPFDAHLLTDVVFKAKYCQESFVKEPLAIILHATDWWISLIAQNAEQSSSLNAIKMLSLVAQLRDQLRKWGFSGVDERERLVDIIIWPERIARLKNVIRNPESL